MFPLTLPPSFIKLSEAEGLGQTSKWDRRGVAKKAKMIKYIFQKQRKAIKVLAEKLGKGHKECDLQNDVNSIIKNTIEAGGSTAFEQNVDWTG